MQPLADRVPIYQNPDSQITLTISGIGKPAAAAAVTRTRNHFKAGRSHAWLNLGIAGHASLPFGQAVIIKKITDAASGQTWFPSCVFTTTLPAHDLLTLEQPGSEYRRELFDMECAGFFQAATGFATLELVQAVKIISDNADQPMDGVAPKLISRLMVQNLHVVEEITQQLLSLSKHLQRLNDPARTTTQSSGNGISASASNTSCRRYSEDGKHSIPEIPDWLGAWPGRIPPQRSSVSCATNWKRPPSGSVNATERTENTFPDGLY